jgi:hypothetical protein
MEKIGRERRSESAWREIVSRQAESGLSVQAFCEPVRVKLPVASFMQRSAFSPRERRPERLSRVRGST